MLNLNDIRFEYSNDTIIEFYISIIFLVILFFILFGNVEKNDLLDEIIEYNYPINKSKIKEDEIQVSSEEQSNISDIEESKED